MAKTLMPMAPSGTRPISTWRRELRTAASRCRCRWRRSSAAPRPRARHRAAPPWQRPEVGEEDGAEEPHPRDAEQRAEHGDLPVRELQVAPGLGDWVPVDPQGRVGGRAGGESPAPHAAQHRQATHARIATASPGRPGDGDQEAAHQVAQQDGAKVPISTMPLPPVSSRSSRCLGQVGVLTGAEQRGVQAHQEHAGQQRGTWDWMKPSQRHDADLQRPDELHHAGFVVLVGQLPAAGREQQ